MALEVTLQHNLINSLTVVPQLKLANKYKFIILYIVVIELLLQGMAFAAQNSKPLNLMILTAAIQTDQPLLKSPTTVNHATNTNSDFFSSLTFPLPPGIHASFGPTFHQGSTVKPTECPRRIWQTNCPNSVYVHTLCSLKSKYATNCPATVRPTECPGPNDVPTFCLMDINLATHCKMIIHPTHCVQDEGTPTIPSICSAFPEIIAPTYCINDDPWDDKVVPTNCPEELLPTNCPDQTSLGDTECSGDSGVQATQCQDGSVNATQCVLEDGSIQTVPTFCPPIGDPPFADISPTHCLYDLKGDGSPIFIITTCPDERHSTECPGGTLVATHCAQDGLPPIITTNCPDGTGYPTACPDDDHNPTTCIDGENVCRP